MHFGNYTRNVDERGEVALLTRNIKIEGVMGDKCKADTKDDYEQKCKFMYGEDKDLFGGHIRVW